LTGDCLSDDTFGIHDPILPFYRCMTFVSRCIAVGWCLAQVTIQYSRYHSVYSLPMVNALFARGISPWLSAGLLSLPFYVPQMLIPVALSFHFIEVLPQSLTICLLQWWSIFRLMHLFYSRQY
jgi:hypothetical protein